MMFPQIRAVVAKIPKGKVATYGAVARAAGFPGAARRWCGLFRDQPADYRGTGYWAQAERSCCRERRVRSSGCASNRKGFRFAEARYGWSGTSFDFRDGDSIMKKSIMKQTLMTMLVCGVALAQTKTAAVKPDLLNPATLKARAPETYKVKFTTTKGDVIIQVTRAWAPNAADRFYNLVRAGFFTDAAFFRVLPGFMAQFGISSRPEVAKVWNSANIPDDPVKQSNKRGMVTFAQTSMPNSRSTQLFINYGDNSRLDADRFAPFGQVIEGMENVDKIYSGYGEKPDQGRIIAQGKAYLDRNFPNLDKIITATILPSAPAASKPPASKQ